MLSCHGLNKKNDINNANVYSLLHVSKLIRVQAVDIYNFYILLMKIINIINTEHYFF